MVYDNDDSKFHVIIGNVLLTQRDKIPEGRKKYRLWFKLSPNGAYSPHFVSVTVDQIRDASTWGLACLNFKRFCRWKKPL